ncbi:hypothetical protein DPMN_071515 [Dreissena polymorpha]|uniref:Uncharacterized protein n=1 Tax=Dreissena polymorpha TaxID=45954 RepID=A0A9D3Z2U5_DREPO|nr:hypothetical protein DPMN_071515 [Dreissena polymorpha]
MEISFHDSRILDLRMEVVIDCNNNEVPEGNAGPYTSTPIATKQKSHAPVVRIIQTLGAILKTRRNKFVEIHERLH